MINGLISIISKCTYILGNKCFKVDRCIVYWFCCLGNRFWDRDWCVGGLLGGFLEVNNNWREEKVVWLGRGKVEVVM